jgi:hypothetical protein
MKKLSNVQKFRLIKLALDTDSRGYGVGSGFRKGLSNIADWGKNQFNRFTNADYDWQKDQVNLLGGLLGHKNSLPSTLTDEEYSRGSAVPRDYDWNSPTAAPYGAPLGPFQPIGSKAPPPPNYISGPGPIPPAGVPAGVGESGDVNPSKIKDMWDAGATGGPDTGEGNIMPNGRRFTGRIPFFDDKSGPNTWGDVIDRTSARNKAQWARDYGPSPKETLSTPLNQNNNKYPDLLDRASTKPPKSWKEIAEKNYTSI